MKETDGMAADGEREEKLQTGDNDNVVELVVESGKLRVVDGAESMERAPSIAEVVPEFCRSFAETALQLTNT